MNNTEESKEEVYTYEEFINQPKKNCKRCYREGHLKSECEYTTFRTTKKEIPLSHDIKLKLLSIYHWFQFK